MDSQTSFKASKNLKDSEQYRIENIHNYSVDVDTRKIYLADELEGFACVEIVKDLHYLESKSPAPISIYVNSPGGSVDQMFFMYDAIKSCQCPVVTVGTGGIYSAAGLILVSGDLRLTTPHAYFMAHQVQNFIVGAENEVEAQISVGRKMSANFWKIMETHTKITAKVWESKVRTKGELWFDASEMLTNGIVDQIIQPRETADSIIKQYNFDISQRIF